MRNELLVDEAFFQRSLRVTEPDVRYADIREEPFAIYGLYAPKTEPALKRLPDSVGRAINETAARLYTNPSGGRVRFATDSRYIAVRVRVPYVARRTIMPLLTTAGIDVYAREDGRDVYQTSIRPPRDMTDGYESIAYLPDRRMREVTLYPAVQRRDVCGDRSAGGRASGAGAGARAGAAGRVLRQLDHAGGERLPPGDELSGDRRKAAGL